MASLIPGFQYDIFISYRQKDNKYEGWVTQFVDNLKKELEATSKEEISVYFDINPYDGLLETHDVDASLKEKLKCLIFIPIISRTYCDSKSFAWEQEFKAFVEMASNDQFGLKVKLPRGNVASRVLPIRIHDLDDHDVKECESVLGGVLRGIEFIYKEPGVNRPLNPTDHEEKNLNHTTYRNQINKVALAISDTVNGLNRTQEAEVSFHEEVTEKIKGVNPPVNKLKSKTFRLLTGFIITALLVGLIIIGFPDFIKSLFSKKSSPETRLGVAVMPFQNISNDTNLYSLQEIIQESLVNSLSNYSQELMISLPETVRSLISSKGFSYSSLTPSISISLSKILDAGILISGSISQIGTTIRIGAQVIDTKNGEVFRSFQVEHSGNEDELFPKIDSLTRQVTDYLRISKLKKEYNIGFQQSLPTNSPDAYRNFQIGKMYFNKNNFKAAREFYARALEIDSNFVLAAMSKALSSNNAFILYKDSDFLKDAHNTQLKIYKKKDQLSVRDRISLERQHAAFFQSREKAIEYTRQLIALDENSHGAYFNLGSLTMGLGNYTEALAAFEKSLEILKKWGQKPYWINHYYNAGLCCYHTGQFKKERIFLELAERDFPDDYRISILKASLALSEYDTASANLYFKKYISDARKASVNDISITNTIGRIFSSSDIFKKENVYIDQVLSYFPGNPDWLNAIAFALIEMDHSYDLSLKLIDEALLSQPDNPYFLDTKGWCLYKLGRLDEAVPYLEKAIKLLEPGQDDILNQHLEAAKMALDAKQ